MQIRHIVIPTQYYEPEIFQVNYLVRLFLAKGWKVTVIAPTPSYPSASWLRTISPSSFRHCGLTVHRFPVLKRNGTAIVTVINSIQFAVIASFVTFFYSVRYPKAEIFAVQYSPFTCIIPACVTAFLLNKEASIWIFDLWPQSVSVLLGDSLLARWLYSATSSCVSTLYSVFSRYYISSPSFMDTPVVRTLNDVQLLYSWEPAHVVPRLGDLEPDTSLPIRIVSIGNLGAAHSIDLIEKTLLYTSSSSFTWTFAGGGSGMTRLKSFCNSHNLKHVTFSGFLSKEDCLHTCAQADLSIVPFRDSEVSNTICFRFISSLSVATPVISFGSNTVSELVRHHCCGLILDDSDTATLPDHITSLSIPSLIYTIQSKILAVRSHYRKSSLALFKSRFSENAAEMSLQSFFADN